MIQSVAKTDYLGDELGMWAFVSIMHGRELALAGSGSEIVIADAGEWVVQKWRVEPAGSSLEQMEMNWV